MVIYNKNAEFQLIHEAYGVKLEGKYYSYESPWSDSEYDTVIGVIKVNGREVNLGGHEIVAFKCKGIINMEEDKDLLCNYFAHNKVDEMDDWTLEHFFLKEYHSCLWKYHTQQRILRERIEAENKKAAEERTAKRNAKIAEFQAYADKKGLRMIVDYDRAYFVKIDKRVHKNSEQAEDQLVLDFAQKYPGHGIEIKEVKGIC